MSSTPDNELRELLRRYICTHRMQLCSMQLQSKLQAVSKEYGREILKQQEGEFRFTALHCAAARCHKETIEIILNYVDVERRYELLEIQDSVGQTALHRAASGGNIGPINCMIDSLRSPELKIEFLKLEDKYGKTASARAIHSRKIPAATHLAKIYRQLNAKVEKKKVVLEGKGN